MKSLELLPCPEGKISVTRLREENIKNIKELLSRNADISIKEIFEVGIVEDGSMQFKVPKAIRDRQILYLLAYLVWFYKIKAEEIE
jgi:hypothetical protein